MNIILYGLHCAIAWFDAISISLLLYLHMVHYVLWFINAQHSKRAERLCSQTHTHTICRCCQLKLSKLFINKHIYLKRAHQFYAYELPENNEANNHGRKRQKKKLRGKKATREKKNDEEETHRISPTILEPINKIFINWAWMIEQAVERKWINVKENGKKYKELGMSNRNCLPPPTHSNFNYYYCTLKRARAGTHADVYWEIARLKIANNFRLRCVRARLSLK